MQAPNWNDLRFLLAISRGRTLAAAAKQMSVDSTTVTRRLAALQGAVKAQLVRRIADGTFELTPAGETALRHAENIEQHAGLLQSQVSGADTVVAGSVRLTAVPIIVNRLLTPAADELLRANPRLDIELVADARNLSLTRREADIALRLARPRHGGSRIKTQRIGTLQYGVYAAAASAPSDDKDLAWISYEESYSHLPQVRWMAKTTGTNADLMSRLRVSDAEAAMEAIATGLGRSLLPCIIGDRDARLRRSDDAKLGPLPSRDVWLVVHADLVPLARIKAVRQWLDALFK